MTHSRAARRCRRLSLGIGPLLLVALPNAASRAFAQQNAEERPLPSLDAEFARLVPDSLARAIRCRRADPTRSSAGVISNAGLSCGGRALAAERGTPFIAFIDLDAEGRMTRFILEWTVGVPAGDDTLRTARLDSAYAESQAFVAQHLGRSRMICRSTPLWQTSKGILVTTPPRRGRMHSTPSFPPQRPGPEYASWALALDRSWQPTAEECSAPSAPRG